MNTMENYINYKSIIAIIFFLEVTKKIKEKSLIEMAYY